jgi:uncharacterized glyoxalase superfamily protein PhnB
MHSELSLGQAVIMVSSPNSQMESSSPRKLPGMNQSLCVHVDDPDRHYQNAVAAGSEIVRDLRDEDYGSRGYMAKDLEGHLWYFGTYRPGSHWESSSAGAADAG